MIDKVRLITSIPCIGELQKAAETNADIKLISSGYKTSGVYYDTYLYRGLCIKATETKTTIEGSLHKFARGDNVSRFAPIEARKAVDEIANTLQIGLDDLECSQIEFAYNIQTRKPPKEYYSSLVACRGLQRTELKGSIYFVNSDQSRTVVIYDKIKECKQRHIPIPKELEGLNILRIEERHKGRKELQRIFQTKSFVTLSDIVSRNGMYCMRLALWHTWENINKKTMKTRSNETLTLKRAKDYIVSQYLKMVGISETWNQLIETFPADEVKQKTANIKASLKGMISSKDIEETQNNLIEELGSGIVIEQITNEIEAYKLDE